jgi:hypothetical protein
MSTALNAGLGSVQPLRLNKEAINTNMPNHLSQDEEKREKLGIEKFV